MVVFKYSYPVLDSLFRNANVVRVLSTFFIIGALILSFVLSRSSFFPLIFRTLGIQRTGSLMVVINSARDAEWQFRTQDTQWSELYDAGALISDLPEGEYYIRYTNIPYLGTPPPTTGVLVESDKIRVIYASYSESLASVKASMIGYNGGQWRLTGDTEWLSSGEVLEGIAPVTTMVEFSPVEGYQTPEPQQVTLIPFETTEITANYVPLLIDPTTTPPAISDFISPTESQPSTTQTPDPTATHTPTPTPQNTPRRVIENPVTPPDDCPRFAEGDATCDENITGEDYACWREQFIAFMTGATVPITDSCPRHADFDQNNAIGLLDYAIWRASYIREAAN